MAQSGYNGNNATKVGLSTTLSVSITDGDGNPIDVSNSSKYIDVWIPRDLSLVAPAPTYVNTTLQYGRGASIPVAFDVTASNASAHFELTPKQSKNVGYVVLQQFGSFPVYNSTHSNYKNWQLLCPNGRYLLFSCLYETQLNAAFVKLLFQIT
jgi:hypothetical protein